MGFKCGPYQELTSGGNVSFTSGCKIHTFTSSGTFINSSSNSYYADILVVGGGGGSGYDGPTPIVIGNMGGTAGGGAGGSVLKRKWVTISNNTSFPTIIGSAGNSSPNVNIEGGGPGTGGGDTIFNSPGNNGVSELKAPGGAKGAESRDWLQGHGSVNIDNPLGSGGGGSASWGDGIPTGPGTGANVIGYGFSGGNNGGYSTTNGGAGGGGGAGSGGVDGGPGSNSAGGLGGDGLPISDFTDNPLDYAGVGGGGSPLSFPGTNSEAINSAPRHPQDKNSSTHYGRGGAVGPNNNRQSQDGIVIIKLI